MATKRKKRNKASDELDLDAEGTISEEEAQALAGAPADGEDESPPIAPEQLQFPGLGDTDDDDDLGGPFGLDPQRPEWAQSLGVRDDSVSRAQEASEVMREANASLLLHRTEPTDWHGHNVGGFIKRFYSPFSLHDVQSWAAENRGGGKYRYWIIDGSQRIRGGGTFPISGDPKIGDEVKRAEQREQEREREHQRDGGASSDRTRELERQLADERLDRMMQMMAQQRREDQAEMRRLMEKISDDRSNRPDMMSAIAPVLASLAPVLQELVRKQPPPPPPDHFKELAVMQERFQTEMMRFNREMLEKGKKPDRTEEMMARAFEVMVKKSMGVGEHDPMRTVNNVLEQVLPNLVSSITDMAIDKALGGGDDKPKELTPLFIAEKVADLVKDTTEKITSGRGRAPQAPPALPPGYPPQGYMPGPPPGAYAAPPPQVEGWPITGNQEPSAPAPAPAASPAMAPPTVAPPPPGAPASPPRARPAPPEQPSHVASEVFQKAAEFLQAGKSGEDLAVWVDDHNDGNRLLSRMALQYLEETAPFYLTPYIIEAAPPELAPVFDDPRAKQMLSDFCDFFYNSEPADDDGSDDAEGDDAGGDDTDAPAAPAPQKASTE